MVLQNGGLPVFSKIPLLLECVQISLGMSSVLPVSFSGLFTFVSEVNPGSAAGMNDLAHAG